MRFRCLGLTILVLLAFAGCGEDKKPKDAQASAPLQLGAYYNPWFGSDAKQWANYLRKKLTIQQTPVIGEYNCRDIAVIKKHIEWAQAGGIDFFAMNWYGPNTETDITVKEHWAKYLVKTQSSFKFCITYQTLFILDSAGGTIPVGNNTAKQLLLDHFTYLATEYFAHPNYLKINNRPVVFLKFSRLLTGDYDKTIAKVKTIVRHQKEFDIFLVGDEVWWKGLTPQRIKSFDAITAYSMQGPLQYDGLPLLTGFFTDLESKFDEYKTEAAKNGVAFIPGVMPGYNDRGSAPEAKHGILPREANIDAENDGATYRLYLQSAKKYLDPSVNMLMITSFNEWAEDTQIEPAASSFLTPSKHPAEITGGHNYYGYNDLYLKITKEEKAQVTGNK